MKKRILALLLTAAMAAGLLAGCGGTPSQSGAPGTDAPGNSFSVDDKTVIEAGSETIADKLTDDGWLVMGVNAASVGFDPTTDQNYYGIPLVYDSLFTYDNDGEIVGLLAKEWEWIDDTHLQITLQPDATFSNGDPVTSEDALYSLERYFTEGSRWSTYFTSIDFESSQIVDDKTFIIAYSEVCGPALQYLAIRHSSVLNKAYCESSGDDAFWDGFPCSGAYTCLENVSGSYATFQRRDDYWGAQPQAEFIKIIYYTETTTMMVDYENGSLDLVIGITDNDVNRIQNGEVDHTNLVVMGYFNQYSLSLPEYNPVFDDIRVRQAIAHAIDAEAVAMAAFGTLYQTSTSTLPADIPFHIDVGQYEYDPELAKQLLEEAGYSAGDLSFRMIVVNFPYLVSMAEAIQAYLEAVGITMTVEPYAQPVAVGYIQEGQSDVVINNNAEGVISADADQWYNTTKSNSTNASVMISDETYNSYLQTGISTLDQEVRQEAYENAQQWMYDNCRMIPICDGLKAYAYKDYITNADCYTPITLNLREVTFAS